jgi:hypothetical protein
MDMTGATLAMADLMSARSRVMNKMDASVIGIAKEILLR